MFSTGLLKNGETGVSVHHKVFYFFLRLKFFGFILSKKFQGLGNLAVEVLI